MIGWDATLYLEKGHVFEGKGFGCKSWQGGEAVFNTGMTGYQEVFTDLSYYKQIVVMTYPHIGNTGTNGEDRESGSIGLSGVVVREYCERSSSWRSTQSLDGFLSQAKLPGISEVDTREITQILRDEGAQRAVIFPTEEAAGKSLAAHGSELLRGVSPMEGLELVSKVSCSSAYEYKAEGEGDGARGKHSGTVVVYDFGVKAGILRQLKGLGLKTWVVPYRFPHQEVMAYKPSAVVLSNGPGDPAEVPGAVDEIRALIGKVPILAICMGHQLLARSLGCQTYKLKFGHHGVNHPVKDLIQNRILITSQNHGFAVKEEDLSRQGISVSHVNLNDHTVEGFVSEKMRFYSVQFHPEAKPGPSDAGYIFESFLRGYLR